MRVVEMAVWWSEVVDLRVEMVPEVERSMVVELFLECSIDNPMRVPMVPYG
ncbi:hypothetical protein Tco_0430599, partial [Tanacetum coccineum]